MARPLNKRYFGEGTGIEEKLAVRFHNGTTGVVGYIVKQTGSKRFVCSDGTATTTCYLADKDIGDLLAGEMSITVKNDAAVVSRVVKISARRATLSDGSTTAWNFDDSIVDGKVEIERFEEDDFEPVVIP